jgi:hypothetical protein
VARTTGCCTETTERALVSNEAWPVSWMLLGSLKKPQNF